MIPCPFRWRPELVRDGLVLVHPNGAESGTIVYSDRMRPLARVGDLVRSALARTPAFRVESMSPVERLVTREGEHAAALTILGLQRGVPVQRDLGFVFGDDFYAQISGLCTNVAARPELAALVRELTRQDSQVLGLRRRRFEYTPPRGWQPIPHSLATEWIAPDFPGNRAWIMVYPANPVTLVPEATLAASVQYLRHLGYEVEEREPESLRVGPLVGHSQIVSAKLATEPAPMLREIVRLASETFSYTLELSNYAPHTWTDTRNVFRSLIDSIEPIPHPDRHERGAEALSFLAE